MNRMNELVDILNEASKAYYGGEEIMSNIEYDALYDELLNLEKTTGVVFPNSPTQNVGYEVAENLPRVKHEHVALSLDKTKDIREFEKIFDRKAIVSWKLDGSTLILTYDGGRLTRAETRGDGIVGYDVTHNAKWVKGVPQEIKNKNHFVVRGEVVMSYESFDKINETLDDEEKYKNPRNLANASIQLLDASQTATRGLEFFAFTLVESNPHYSTIEDGFDFLKKEGFGVVEYKAAMPNELLEIMNSFSNKVSSFKYPVDGLVVSLNDVDYTSTLEGTSRHPHKLAGFALKWADEIATTRLLNIEWSPSRTGLINPVAIFEPVELEGTTVSRASTHNVSETRRLLGDNMHVGEKVFVFKANKIIPQISKGEPSPMGNKRLTIPTNCPCCGKNTIIKNNDGIETLFCENPMCPAKLVGSYVHFVNRDNMNIDGLSEETLKKFVSMGFIKDYCDIFTLVKKHRNEIEKMEGFGKKSCDNLEKAIENSLKNVTFVKLLSSMGIPLWGKSQLKNLYRYFINNEENKGCDYVLNLIEGLGLFSRTSYTFIDGVGDVMQKALEEWGDKNIDPFMVLDPVEEGCDVWDDTHGTSLSRLMRMVTFEKPSIGSQESLPLVGKTFCVTGDVHIFKNRNELQAKVEEMGGKCSSSVTSKTTYLINNDIESLSSKNKKAKELGIPIISEEDFLALL